MIGQSATQAHSPPPPPHPPPSRVGDANVDMLACSPFDTIASSLQANPADHRRPSAKAPHPSELLKCPRCDSIDTKFCYYNNYSLTQPRYFCKNCKRYWTAGGALRNVPVGGGLRKNKRSKLKLAAVADAEAALAAHAVVGAAGTHQQYQTKAVAAGAGATGEVPQTVDNRLAAASAIVAMPSHLAVGVPELGRFVHSSGDRSTISHVGGDHGSAPPHFGNAMLDQNGGAVAPTLDQQEANLYGRNEQNGGTSFFCEPGHAPQFYSSYAASLPIQFGNAVGGAAPGYAANYNFLSMRENANAEPLTSDEQCSHKMHGMGASTANIPSREETKQEKDVEGATHYDWQLISEGLFNGAGAADGNFFYVPSATGWPDFSQFNDSTGGPGDRGGPASYTPVPIVLGSWRGSITRPGLPGL